MIQQQIPIVLPDSIPSKKEELEMLKQLPFDEFVDRVVSSMVTFAINLAIAILVFYVGKFIIRKVVKVISTILIRRKVDKSLSTFVISLVRMLMYFLLIVTVIGILGIETSSFIALFASAGVAIGMALSGTLQNFAGGVLILLLKPYKVGDYIEAQGYAGTVSEIQIFHTIISTYDNKSIIIPNGGLSTGTVNNWTKADYRRVEWKVSISYGDDVDNARKTILAIFDSDDRIVRRYIEDDREMRALNAVSHKPDDEDDSPAEEEQKIHNWIWRIFHRQHAKVRERISAAALAEEKRLQGLLPKVDRSPAVWVDSLGESSVNLVARAWTHIDFYWALYYQLNERIYTELPKAGVNFPFPQMDVHMKS